MVPMDQVTYKSCPKACQICARNVNIQHEQNHLPSGGESHETIPQSKEHIAKLRQLAVFVDIDLISGLQAKSVRGRVAVTVTDKTSPSAFYLVEQDGKQNHHEGQEGDHTCRTMQNAW